MKSYDVKWTDVAKKDLYEIIEYISLDSKEIAKQQYFKIKTMSLNLTKFPEKGRIVPELKKQNIERYREIIISPWRLFYRIEHETVYILAVIDGRRNIEDVLLARNLR
jgi:toxin ParE1/3/4